MTLIFIKRYSFELVTAIFFGLACFSLTLGETPWNEVWKDAFHIISSNLSTWNPLLDERLPRLIILSCTGAALPVAGLVMQAVFCNPLAAPSVLGISAGSHFAVTLILILGLHHLSTSMIPLAAIGGAFTTLLFVHLIKRHQTTHSLILAGMAISTLLLAIQDFFLYAVRDNWILIQTLSEWQMGNTAHMTWQDVQMQLPATLLGLWGCWHYRREIDLFSLGEEQAMALGVHIPTVRWRLFIYTALLTGSATAVLGIVPFLGLIMPHLLRQFRICLAKSLIPLCIVSGASLLIAIDSLLRLTKFNHATLGNTTALLGGLFFLCLLIERPQKKYI